MQWTWESIIVAKPLSESPMLARYMFNSQVDLENISPILSPLGTMETLKAPQSLGINGNVLHLLTPDGSPVGFGLQAILPKSFGVAFNYAGVGEGLLQLKLDGAVIKEIPLSAQDLGSLVPFSETFSAAGLGIDPYSLHEMSFVLKGAGDPELYMSNLVLSNPSVVPEPASMLLYGLGGLVMAAFKRRKKSV